MPCRRLSFLLPACLLLLLAVPAPSRAQPVSLPPNRGFASVQELLVQRCAACHGWTGSHREIVGEGRIAPGRPEASSLFVMVDTDRMPLTGPNLTQEQKLLLRTWIQQGATASEEPLAVPAATSGATSEASAGDAVPRPSGLARSVRFHQISGFTSAGLLLGAGAVGTAKILTFMSAGHDFRETAGPGGSELEEWGGAACRGEFERLWNTPTQQALRWTHVGLLVGGNGLYLANAVTGLGFPRDPRPGLTPRRIHRYAFYTHAALMTANIVLGFLTTDVLERGVHGEMIGLAIAHAAVGVAVPAVMIGAGIAINASQR